MTLYVESSAFVKLYLREPDADTCERILVADPDWVSARHTVVEVRRNIARALRGQALEAARRQFADDWRRVRIVELDVATCEMAAGLAEETGVRSLDALHVAAARHAGGGPVLTYDLRLAQAARSLGMTVIGA